MNAAVESVPMPELPDWAQVGEKRRAHIARVTALLDRWAREMSLPLDEKRAWHDAGRLHDALRDASESELRAQLQGTPFAESPYGVLHGPAAAARLERDGEQRTGVLLAVRWHTVGNAAWDRTGRALFMADFPRAGAQFRTRRTASFLVHRLLPRDFDGVFRRQGLVQAACVSWNGRCGKGSRFSPRASCYGTR